MECHLRVRHGRNKGAPQNDLNRSNLRAGRTVMYAAERVSIRSQCCQGEYGHTSPGGALTTGAMR